MKPFLQFLGGALLFGVASLGIGYGLQAENIVLQGGVPYALAAVPATLTMAWVCRGHVAPDMQLLAALGGSGIRMGIALGGGYLLTTMLPESFDATFWLWLLWFYLGLLALEITLLVRQLPGDDKAAPK